MNARASGNRKENPEKCREYKLQKQYNMSIDDYNVMLEDQGGKCAICGTTDPQTKRKDSKYFCVDHNHETHKVRGLLCRKCNLGLGHFEDDPANLASAITYLRNQK
jgi:hypothetical protein